MTIVTDIERMKMRGFSSILRSRSLVLFPFIFQKFSGFKFQTQQDIPQTDWKIPVNRID